MLKVRQSPHLLHAALIAVSGLLWTGIVTFNKHFLSHTNFAVGIELVYLPAGIRLVIVMLFGVWGAIGIVIANPFLVPLQIGQQSASAVAINSLIAGFVPYITLRGVQEYLGIDSNLSSLRPLHIPFLALAVSVTTPLVNIAQFYSLGLVQSDALTSSISAMVLGDFLGCLVALLAFLGIITLLRHFQK